MTTEEPDLTADAWQLRLFRRTLKKQQKLHALLDIIGDVSDRNCLLITCGDNNGALNWHFKQQGGNWSWADFENDSIRQIGELTGDLVESLDPHQPSLPYEDAAFDIVIAIDVHEHLKEPHKVNAEIDRLTKSGGMVVVTTPNGDRSKLANRIRWWLGMRPEDYGHMVPGYDVPELEAQLEEVGLEPFDNGSYSRFFTEMMELAINVTYVKILAGRSKAKVEKGQISPQSEDQLRSVKKSYALYSRTYPFLLIISKLDVLDLSPRGYAVIVAARKN